MSKNTYRLEALCYGRWHKVIESSMQYCRGYMAAKREYHPHLAHQLLRSDGRVIDRFEASEDVSLGQVAGWLRAEQYEAAADRALKRAKSIREANAERAKSDVDVPNLARCRCGGKAVIRIELAPPPHPHSTHTGDWTPDQKLARVECAACHIQTGSVPEDMLYTVVGRWNGN